MTRILLTGAGFSYNWGGILASEVLQYLLGCEEVDDGLRRLLWRDRSLMVIWYSFSDAHINDAIMEAIKKSDLKIFLVDPAGDKILDKRDPRAMIPDRPGPLLDVIPPRIIGISQRPISSTFKDDTVEHSKLCRFFG